MKNIALIIVCISTSFSFGQLSKKRIKYSINSPIKVFYDSESTNTFGKNRPVAFFVNDVFLRESSMQNVNVSQIEDIKVEKEEFTFNKQKYFGKVFIKMKENYKPNFISLKELTDKFLSLNKKPILFKINDKIIYEDYKNYLIDENFILKIRVSKVEASKISTEINVVEIITKTSENIKKANEVRIK